jgi:single-stranded-DNA-specific exonuclease
MTMGEQINLFNTERRNLDQITTKEALEQIEGNEEMKCDKATIVYKDNWHKGVIGIVASRLTENYYRPTIVLTQADGLITGSARSIKDFDIYDAIDACSDLLEHFGGHKYAAGLSMKPEMFPAFRKRFEDNVRENITEEMLQPEIGVDAELKLSDITPKFFRVLKQFAPFGPGNMSPVFLTRDVVDSGYARIVGKNHLKLTIAGSKVRSLPFAAIAFQQGHHFDKIVSGTPFDIVYHIEENVWNGQSSIQLNIKDIRF